MKRIVFQLVQPRYWMKPNYLPEGIFDRLKVLLEPQSQKDLHVQVVEKKALEQK